jgi:hypothetical protein
MSSILTPKRRERAKKKSRATAHSMSPSIRQSSSNTTTSSSSSKHNRSGRLYQAMTDDDDDDDDVDTENGNGTLSPSDKNSSRGQFSKSSNNVPRRIVTPTNSMTSTTSSTQYHSRDYRKKQQNPTFNRHSWDEMEKKGVSPSTFSKSKQGLPHYRSSSFNNRAVQVVSTTPSFASASSQQEDSLHQTSMDNNDDDDYDNDADEPFDEDMPMDERLDRKYHPQQQKIQRYLPYHSRSTDSDSRHSYRSVTPTKEVSDIVMAGSSSYDGGSTETKGILRIVATLNSGSSTRPKYLNREECILWDALQTAMVNDRNEHLTKRRNLERSLQESTLKLGQVSVRETELELQLAKSKCECADLEHKYTLSLARNRALVGQISGKKDTIPSDDDNTTNSDKRVEALERMLQNKQEELEQQRKDHDAEVRAIQRVLADITSDKMKLEDQVAQLERNPTDFDETKEESPTGISRDGIEAKPETDSTAILVDTLKRELSESRSHALTITAEKKRLESEIESVRVSAANRTTQVDELKVRIDGLQNETSSLKKENEMLQVQVDQLSSPSDIHRTDSPKPEMDHPQPELSGAEEEENETQEAASNELKKDEILTLKQSLTETESSLENAKKIIASLENANGSLTLDLRSKLKLKEEELSVAQKESDERKRRLDSLATELRDLQRRQGDMEEKSRRSKAHVAKQKALVEHLRTSMADLQSAIVVHEASVSAETGVADRTSIEEISEILADTLHAVKVTLESTEELMEDADDVSVGTTDVEVNSEVGRHIDAIIRSDREAAAKELRTQLDQKRIAVKRLEEALRKQHEEMKKMRAQLNGQSSVQGRSDEQLRAEVLSLRQQCATNLDVLAKKERELSVLRSSLKVDDNESGYISDDASDDDEDTVDVEKRMPSPTDLESYGPAEAEAYATILSQTTGGVGITGRKREVEALKIQLMKARSEKETANKELKVEQESLANAKMIISSLEQANKGMMEDLRCRLQDSNTAIASLLDKSMEHEKDAEKYREEVEKLNLEKQQEREKYDNAMKKLQERLMTPQNAVCHTSVSTTLDVALTEEKKEEVLFADI